MISKKQNWYIWLAVIFLLAVFWELFIFIRLPKQAFIQGLLESWFVSQGLVFYKDFAGQYFPFLRLLMVPLHEIFGLNQYTTIILAPITSITILFLLFLASNKWLSGWFKLIPIIFFSIWHTFLSNNHFVAASFLGASVLVSMILWLSWWDKPTLFKSFLIGLFTSFSVFTLQIVLPFGILLNASLLLKFRVVKPKEGLSHLFLSICGFLIPTLIIILWFLDKDALYDLYIQTIKYHFTNYPYSNLGRGVENILIYLSIHLPIILFFITAWKNVKKSAIFLTYLSLPLVFWFAIFHPLRFEISLPAFALIFGLAIQDLFQNRSSKIRKVGLVLLFLILLINIFTIFKYKLINYRERLFETKYSHEIISEVYSDDPMYDAIGWMKLNSNPSDRIFVLGDALFYVKSERLLANRRAVASEAFVFTPFEQFKTELESSWPSYWVVDERLWKRFDNFGYKQLGGDFQKLIEKDPVVAKFDYWTIRKH